VALGRVDNWLAREFAPHRVAETLRALAEARPSPAIAATDDDVTTTIAECDRKPVEQDTTGGHGVLGGWPIPGRHTTKVRQN
jgi:hypothetical protein